MLGGQGCWRSGNSFYVNELRRRTGHDWIRVIEGAIPVEWVRCNELQLLNDPVKFVEVSTA